MDRALLDRVTGSSVPGHHRDAGLLRQPPRRRLVAQQFQQLRARADERDARALAGRGRAGFSERKP